jgi:quercetin dioxygenase-like cupin family protein
LYALCGTAIQWVDGIEYIMTPGTAMLIPKNVVRWMRNDWDEEFEVIGIYPEAPNFEETDQHVSDDWEAFGFTPRPAGKRR